ncbi:ISL3 family transposase [Streptomyces sp. NBC_00448]|uniref:ISL3 family transposase n=1 Tax=Streptomyces sp. NBC_00448 TaxID=2903652 RepID=UPI002E1F4193
MSTHDTEINRDATRLLGLEGVSVTKVKDDGAGGSTVYVVTGEDSARACPSCGVFATRLKDYRTTAPRHLACGGRQVSIRWRKARWHCTEAACARRTFTEAIPQVPARMRTTAALREAAGAAVADGGRTVVQAGRDLGLSWPIVQHCFEVHAARSLPAEPAETEAIGIDETRRGKPVWKQNPDTDKWELVADAWHIGFVDAIGGRGLFGQVEGRNAASVAEWLALQPATWREAVRYVAIDLCATFRAAIHRALPHAKVVVDCFHIVQLAQRHLADLRRRLTWKQHGRRARKGDSIYTVRKILRRNKEDLNHEQRQLLKTELEHMGTYGKQIYAAWQSKELLRDLLHLAVTRRHVTPDHSTISAARHRFFSHVADHAHLPELVTLAETVEQWWDGIETYLTTGITNAASEGNNRLIKLEARNAFGFSNRTNQRLRSRCATTRRSRRETHPH